MDTSGAGASHIPANRAISAMLDMPTSPTSVASSGHFPFTTSDLLGIGVDTLALDRFVKPKRIQLKYAVVAHRHGGGRFKIIFFQLDNEPVKSR
uniref:Uncharacterized protein n=1 Tax=Tanacetum cinerariifolium TaxID=118510 RepID=A0A6L2LYM4_TANCI|nr:hypothetical protein [Tanacetum cinerariifolium]